MNLRKQDCIITREEGRKIRISRRNGEKVLTQKELKMDSRKNGSEVGSHKVLMLRAPSEGVADLWCAWLKSAAHCGVGGEEMDSINSHLFEDWRLDVPLPKNIHEVATKNRVESMVASLKKITRVNKKQVEEMRKFHVKSIQSSHQNISEKFSEDLDYPASPIVLSNGRSLSSSSSSTSSNYDCDSDCDSDFVNSVSF